MKLQKLTQAEEEAMHLIWAEDEPCTVSHLISKLPEPRPPHSTISSIFRILERKNFVAHKTYGRTNVYYPLIEKRTYTKFSIATLIGRYFQGSKNALVSFLVEEDDLSVRDLGEIIKKLEKE